MSHSFNRERIKSTTHDVSFSFRTVTKIQTVRWNIGHRTLTLGAGYLTRMVTLCWKDPKEWNYKGHALLLTSGHSATPSRVSMHRLQAYINEITAYRNDSYIRLSFWLLLMWDYGEPTSQIL